MIINRVKKYCQSGLLLIIILLYTHSYPSKRVYTLTVSAGKVNRKVAMVSFPVPSELLKKPLYVRDEQGNKISLQVDRQQTGSFFAENLQAGQEKKYFIETGKSSVKGVGLQQEKEQLNFSRRDKPVLTYYAQAGKLPRNDIDSVYLRGGYIHPVFTPSGKIVSDDYPPNHVHHHGIWAAWTKTEFMGRKPDFWNVKDGTGKVDPVQLEASWQGPVHAGFQATNAYIDLTSSEPVKVLDEIWEVKVYNYPNPQYHIFDLTINQNCATSQPLLLPLYHYGGIGFRGNRQWDGVENTIFLTSEGKGRKEGHGTKARWCHIGGKVDGSLAGITIMDHPGNFRSPQPMRIHPTEPFFCYAPSQDGDWQITPGKTYRARYRFVVYDGPPNVEEIEQLWNDYAFPAEAKLKVE